MGSILALILDNFFNFLTLGFFKIDDSIINQMDEHRRFLDQVVIPNINELESINVDFSHFQLQIERFVEPLILSRSDFKELESLYSETIIELFQDYSKIFYDDTIKNIQVLLSKYDPLLLELIEDLDKLSLTEHSKNLYNINLLTKIVLNCFQKSYEDCLFLDPMIENLKIKIHENAEISVKFNEHNFIAGNFFRPLLDLSPKGINTFKLSEKLLNSAMKDVFRKY